MASCMPLRVCRTLGIALNSALAHAGVCRAQRLARVARVEGSRLFRKTRKFVVDGRGILERGAMKAVELIVLVG
ncbi:MAG TPA: hypothetical protein VJ207_05400 [Thermoplasmata archaeon]|nr:hypothetical protein [Thermoplasmata archaeon]